MVEEVVERGVQNWVEGESRSMMVGTQVDLLLGSKETIGLEMRIQSQVSVV